MAYLASIASFPTMNRHSALVLMLLCCATLPAVVAGGAGEPRLRDDELTGRLSSAPTWVTDPTEGGKRKGVVASWAALAPKDEQKAARAEASEKLIATFKLAATFRIKEMNMWVDADGKTYVHLVAR